MYEQAGGLRRQCVNRTKLALIGAPSCIGRKLPVPVQRLDSDAETLKVPHCCLLPAAVGSF